MLKRLVLLAMSFALLSTQSFAASQSGLKAAFDELSYTMEVEGAALDPEAKKEALDRFSATVEALREQGLSNQEIIAFAQSQVKDQVVAREIAATYSLLQTQKLSQEELREVLKSMSERIYSKGASWSGDTGLYLGIAAFLGVMIALAVLIPADPCANEAYARGNVDACHDSWYNGAYYNI